MNIKTDYQPGDRVRVVTDEFVGLPPGSLGTVRPFPSDLVTDSNDRAFLRAIWPLAVAFDNQPRGKIGNDFYMVGYEEVEPVE